MQKIIFAILFLFCSVGTVLSGSEHLLCEVPVPPSECDEIYHSSNCNAVLCPDNTPFGMTTVVEPVCNSSQYVSTRNPTSGTVTCTLECDVSCIYKCSQGMYGYIAVKDMGDGIYPQISECYACPGGETVVSCGLIEDKELSGQIDEQGNLIQYASKLVCQTGYHESGHDCVPNCPENSYCPDGVFEKCNDGYYGNASDGCKACPSDATCDGGATFTCNDGYILESDACNKCLDSEVCEGGKFVRCADGYYGSGKGNCKVCPANATCNETTFTCKSGYFKYTNETETGCEPCGISRVCDAEKCLYCKSGYYGECAKGCTKCPSLDGHAGTSDTPNNIGRESCYIKPPENDTLKDDFGKYYFEDNNGICNAQPEISGQQTE